jgi:hypothetical protein
VGGAGWVGRMLGVGICPGALTELGGGPGGVHDVPDADGRGSDRLGAGAASDGPLLTLGEAGGSVAETDRLLGGDAVIPITGDA